MDLRNSITMQDKMSSVLRANIKAVDGLLDAVHHLDKTGDNEKFNAAWKTAKINIGAADVALGEMNSDLKKVNQTQEQTHSGFRGWKATFAGIAGAIYTVKSAFAAVTSVTDVVDEYTLTTAKLNLINDGLQTTAQLQENIYQAAQASRGSYSDMASSVSKLGILAGDAFGDNAEITDFAELMQKTFVLGGSSATEQSAGMYQLTQAMAAGKLQGDEFRSIMENAPLLASAIADFTGKSKGELKEMSSEGTITADIIKGALFSAADQINTDFETLPRTFASVMQSVENKVLVGSQGVINQLGAIADSSGFENFANGVVAASVKVIGAMGWIINHARGIGTALTFGVSVWVAYRVATTTAAVTMTIFSGAAQLGLVRTTGLAASMVGYTGTAAGATGATGALTGAVTALNGAMAMNPIGMIALALGVLVGVLGTVAVAYQISASAANDATAANLNYLTSLGIMTGSLPQDAAITAAESKISDIQAQNTSGLPALRHVGANQSGATKAINDLNNNIAALEQGKNYMAQWLQTASDTALDNMLAYTQGTASAAVAKDAQRTLSYWGIKESDKEDLTSVLKSAKTQRMVDNFDWTTAADVSVDDVGTVAEVDKINSDVNISDESLKYLVDGITRQYVNKINLQTVQPNISVTFSGDIKETADMNGVAERLIADMEEKMYSSADLAY